MNRVLLKRGDNMWSKIEKIMIERGMNQNQLAKNMGVRNGIITDLKKGRIKAPINRASRIAFMVNLLCFCCNFFVEIDKSLLCVSRLNNSSRVSY